MDIKDKIDQIEIKHLTDFSRILKSICWIYTLILARYQWTVVGE